MSTITGVAGSAINAQVTVANANTPATQADQEVTAQSIVNDLATIKSGSCTIAGTKTFSAGITLGASCVLTGTAGCSVTGAIGFGAGLTITCTAGAALAGSLSVAGATITGNSSTTIDNPGVTKTTGRTVERAVVAVTDSDQTVEVATANEFKLAVPTATNRTLTIKSTSPAPEAGDWMILSLPAAGTSPTDKWIVQREDATEIAQMRGWNVASGVADMPCTMKIKYTGSVWRGVWATFGVVPGAGF